MSTLVSATVKKDVPQADGTRRVKLRIIVEDSEGEQSVYNIKKEYMPADYDSGADLAALSLQYVEKHMEEEEEKVCNMDLGLSSLELVQGAKRSTQKRMAKKLINWMMSEKDIRIAQWMEPLVTYLSTTYTPLQLANWLGVSVAELSRMNTRYQKALDMKTDLDLFDSEEGELADG